MQIIDSSREVVKIYVFEICKLHSCINIVKLFREIYGVSMKRVCTMRMTTNSTFYTLHIGIEKPVNDY